LTFKIYPHYDHSFAIPMQDEEDEDEDWIWEWMSVFEDFMEWVEQ
jgi:hypothetical protein